MFLFFTLNDPLSDVERAQQDTNSTTQNNVNDNNHSEPNGETNHTFSPENNQIDFQPRTENMQGSGGRE